MEFVHACGQCNPCRYTRRQSWVLRHYLENSQWAGKSAFITLTYAPKWLPGPKGYYGAGGLRKTHLENFFKRLRKNLRGRKIRYIGVGEYGTRNHRPHYHAIIYGIDPLELEIEVWRAWSTKGEETKETTREKSIPLYVKSKLPGREFYGNVHVGADVNLNTIAYCTDYVMKGHTAKGNFENEYPNDDREPEFVTMSRYPGIGREGIRGIAAHMQKFKYFIKDHPETNHWGSKGIETELPNFIEMREAGKLKNNYPLEKYCREKLAEDLGILQEDNDKKRLLRAEFKRQASERNPTISNIIRDYLADESREKLEEKMEKMRRKKEVSGF